MTYQETTNWMFQCLPMYQNQGVSAYRKDLTNTLLLMKHLKNPEHRLQCIHIAGTNGKGSTSSMLSSVFQEAGYKVGLYTSPHLKDFRERIKINGEEISEDFVCSFISENKTFFEKTNMSFFEMSVGLAFNYFTENQVDIAIIEVGMGGRLDSTNVISPILSIITNIGFDHTQFLGNTLEAIATEKAGIIKPNTPVVIGEYLSETKNIFIEIANKKQSRIFFASDLIKTIPPSDLLGNYQQKNKKTVLQSIEVINAETKFRINLSQIQKGLLNVVKNTKLKGRWQQLATFPTIICDTAHNQNGLEIVLKQIQEQKYKKLHLVLGFVNDKNIDTILHLFPQDAIYYFCKPNIPRGLETSILQNAAAKYNLKGQTYNSVQSAYEEAKKKADSEDFIYIGGSTFVVAELPL